MFQSQLAVSHAKTAECQKLRNPPSLRDTMSQMNMVTIYLPNKWFIIHVEHVRAEFRSF